MVERTIFVGMAFLVIFRGCRYFAAVVVARGSVAGSAGRIRRALCARGEQEVGKVSLCESRTKGDMWAHAVGHTEYMFTASMGWSWS